MNRRHLSPVVAGLAVCLIVTACSGSRIIGTAAPRPDRATVDRAASLASGTAATCGHLDRYGEYTCAEQPRTCGVRIDESLIDWSSANADCWEAICDVELDVATPYGAGGTMDVYDCRRTVAGCSSMTGGCPSREVCITGRGRKVAIDAGRTAAFPEDPACLYPGEG